MGDLHRLQCLDFRGAHFSFLALATALCVDTLKSRLVAPTCHFILGFDHFTLRHTRCRTYQLAQSSTTISCLRHLILLRNVPAFRNECADWTGVADFTPRLEPCDLAVTLLETVISCLPLQDLSSLYAFFFHSELGL